MAQSGNADIVNAQGQKIGTATVHPSGGGVRIDVEISQLPPARTAFTFMRSENVKDRLSQAKGFDADFVVFEPEAECIATDDGPFDSASGVGRRAARCDRKVANASLSSAQM
jgi:hypothetical protein